MAEQSLVENDPVTIFQFDNLPPLDNLRYSTCYCNYFDIPIKDTTFDALPWMARFHYDPLYTSLDIVPNHALLQDDVMFGYDKELGFYPKNDQLTECHQNNVVKNVENSIVITSEKQGKRSCTSSEQRNNDHCSKNLSLETISTYFHMPIAQAAKELNIGLTVLKKRCREVGIKRWPQRKLKSLQALVENVQTLYKEELEGGDGIPTSRDVNILKEEIKLLKENPDNKLEDNTKRLRQACFKAKYKKKRLMFLKFESDHHRNTTTNSTTVNLTYDHDEGVQVLRLFGS